MYSIRLAPRCRAFSSYFHTLHGFFCMEHKLIRCTQSFTPLSCAYFFDSIFAVTDFSFVSSVVGIPFATNPNALTVTRCELASRYVWKIAHPFWWCELSYSHSCSQCLQTNNACGWCIYNKVCSGTPAPCSNETNWYQVSLLSLHAGPYIPCIS